ncbi:FtsX-like permease family protein [Bailinhaonella thermotolerans]|uniref:ABC transporter permease n=1 Tax=Bailinhaonella thermotolerans TaxID=1070861 RepID=A0A3A4AHP2_9ACTN|nr:FtsX-like permease family protein [Bailinhaonella thermotolerans]RJL26484.1 ABC transporter permease [Bailinhaonella thermotolerans]
MRSLLVPLLRTLRGPVALVTVLVFSVSALAAGLPRAFESAFDAALRQVTESLAPGRADLQVFDVTEAHPADRAEDLGRRIAAARPSLVARVTSPDQTAVEQTEVTIKRRLGSRAQTDYMLGLNWVSGAERHIRYVSGGPPAGNGTIGPLSGVDHDIPKSHLIPAAVSTATASAMKLKVGESLVVGDQIVRIDGIFEVADPGSWWWVHQSTLAKPFLRHGADAYITVGDALIARESTEALMGDVTTAWTFRTDIGRLTSDQAGELVYRLGAFERNIGEVPPGSLQIREGLRDALGAFQARLASARLVLLLALGGLILVAAGVIVVAVGLVTARLSPGLALSRARGASLGQVAGLTAGLLAVAAVPAAALGQAASWLVPGRPTPFSHLAPALLALAAVLTATLQVVREHRQAGAVRRRDLVAARPSARRAVFEGLIVVLALAGAYTLRSRGLAADPQTGPDPFLLAVPAALALAAGLITLRAYPLPLRLAGAFARRRPGAVPFLGLTLASRAGTGAALPIVILLPAVAVAVFGSVFSTSLRTAQESAAWRNTGADARIMSDAGLTPEALERVRRVPGVTGVVPAMYQREARDAYAWGTARSVLAIDLDAYRRLTAGGPLSVPPAPAAGAAPAPTPAPSASPGTPVLKSGGTVPGLVTPDLRGAKELNLHWPGLLTIRPAGVIDGFASVHAGSAGLVVIPYDSPGRAPRLPAANVAFVAGSADPAALAKAAGLPGHAVKTREAALDEVSSAPLAGLVQGTFTAVSIALAAYALLVIVLALVTGAAERSRTISYLRTLGLSGRQARVITVLEIAPMVTVAAAVGLGLGLALPYLLGPALDMRPYTGGLTLGAFRIDPVTPVALAAGLAAFAVLGAFLHAAASGRRTLGNVLRVGEQ